MDDAADIPLLDVDALLERSEPQARLPWFWMVISAGIALAIVCSNIAQQVPKARLWVELFSVIVAAGLMGTLVLISAITVRNARAEQQAVDGIGELLQLRRWPQAVFMLGQVLSAPMRSQQGRAQALVYLAAALSRYQKYEQAIMVQDYILEHDLVDSATSNGLRLGRAMAMLGEDHLFDADRAISELRRQEGAAESAGLALVEIYRDVKTGHPDDALETFERKLPILRQQLGHRVGDAYGLAARALDLRGRTTEAADAWKRATLLTPVIELVRRYSELNKMLDRYTPTPAPAELV